MFGSRRIHMDISTVEYGKECFDCLRWYVPVFSKSDPCPHCKRLGRPPYPNRVRLMAVKANISLREISRKSGLEWRTVKLISQGERAPHIGTRKKILKTLGMSTKKSNMDYVFPNKRKG